MNLISQRKILGGEWWFVSMEILMFCCKMRTPNTVMLLIRKFNILMISFSV